MIQLCARPYRARRRTLSCSEAVRNPRPKCTRAALAEHIVSVYPRLPQWVERPAFAGASASSGCDRSAYVSRNPCVASRRLL